MVRIGTCGWSYLNAKEYFGDWKKLFRTKLQAYVKLFDLVEVNSTFYALPKLSTAEKWRKEADEIRPGFEFTVKVSQLITHKNPFGPQALQAFEKTKEIAKALKAKILLFQSPASFRPTQENLELAESFFEKIDRESFILVWEVRWQKEWTEKLVKKLFSKLRLNQCVDPFRQECFYAKNLLYFRLHGFGKPTMYNYTYSKKELKELAEKVKKFKKPVYVLFNNVDCYKNALEFEKLLS